MRRLMSTAKTTMHPAASPERNYMLDASAAMKSSLITMPRPRRALTCAEFNVSNLLDTYGNRLVRGGQCGISTICRRRCRAAIVFDKLT